MRAHCPNATPPGVERSALWHFCEIHRSVQNLFWDLCRLTWRLGLQPEIFDGSQQSRTVYVAYSSCRNSVDDAIWYLEFFSLRYHGLNMGYWTCKAYATGNLQIHAYIKRLQITDLVHYILIFEMLFQSLHLTTLSLYLRKCFKV